MTDWRLVLPVIDPDLGQSCMASMRIDPARVIVVDNVPTTWEMPWQPGARIREDRNMGVAASWNQAARVVVRERADMLILCSQAVLFSEPGGQDLIDGLRATDGWGIEVAGAGWHMVGLTRATLETVGPFDEGFWPAYFEDTDLLYRMGLAGLPSPRENGRAWPQIQVDYGDRGYALSMHYGHVHPDFGALAARYHAKWGGDQGTETFKHPFDQADRPLWWWPNTPYPDENPWRIPDAR